MEDNSTSFQAVYCIWNPRVPFKKNIETKEIVGSGGIRTHASEETGALNQRLRPLGHATLYDGLSIIFNAT